VWRRGKKAVAESCSKIAAGGDAYQTQATAT
jgi:hypothetical protein